MTSLVARAPEEAVRILALTQVAKAEQAASRLSDPDDPEALHDFRVSLRRLRTILASYPEAIEGALTKNHLKRLRTLAHGTGSGRDAEVALGWVESQRQGLGAAGGEGLEWLTGRLEKSKAAGYRRVHRGLDEEFKPLSNELQRRLGSYTRKVRIGRGETDTFGHLAAQKLTAEMARLKEQLGGVGSVDDVDECHESRLSAKRLRYLLEPLTRELEQAEAAVQTLKGLQDLLGELNDAHVLVERLARAVERAARKRGRELFAQAAGKEEATAEPASPWAPVDAILAVVTLNRERRDRLFAELESGWTDPAPSPVETAPSAWPRPGGAGNRGAQRRELSDRIQELVATLRHEDPVASEGAPPAEAEAEAETDPPADDQSLSG